MREIIIKKNPAKSAKSFVYFISQGNKRKKCKMNLSLSVLGRLKIKLCGIQKNIDLKYKAVTVYQKEKKKNKSCLMHTPHLLSMSRFSCRGEKNLLYPKREKGEKGERRFEVHLVCVGFN